VDYDINRPWISLDKWQKEYIETPLEVDCHLLTPRQAGKTTAMSIKAVELCINHLKEGEIILINSITERQAMHMLNKAQIYAEAKYFKQICWDNKFKPTMHRIMFKSGKLMKGILCYAAGEGGDSTRGYTIKKLMIDEGSRMSELYYESAIPTLAATKGSMDVASTPCGKLNPKTGEENYFYKFWKDPNFKKFSVNLEDCPRYDKEWLNKQKERLSKLAYAQEFLGQFTDDIKRLFDDEWIKKVCCIKMDIQIISNYKKYLGADIAGMGKDDIAIVGIQKDNNKQLSQIDLEVFRRKFTTDTSRKIKEMDRIRNYKKIGIDDGGVGFGVYSELMDDEQTKRKTTALNNASRIIGYGENESKRKALKEEMYQRLIVEGEMGRLKLFDDDEIKASLSSIQHDEGKIFGSNSHITEALIRAVWEATEDKSLNIFVRSF
jgi:hypothetical protein